MANGDINKAAAVVAAVAQYPELAGLEATLDSLAAQGRTEWSLRTQSTDHATMIEEHVNTTLKDKKYAISKSVNTITVSWIASV